MIKQKLQQFVGKKAQSETKQILEWLSKRKDYNKVGRKLRVDVFNCVFNINYPPNLDLTLEVVRIWHTKDYEKLGVIFRTKDFVKIHYPKKMEYAYKKDERREMLAIKTNSFWAYNEQIGNLLISGFGMDMTMPFLAEQNWEPVEDYDRIYRILNK